MNRIRSFAVGTVMMFALAAGAQEAVTAPAADKDNHSSTQTSTDPVEQHLKKLSQELSLTPDQEDQIRPVLREMHESMARIEKDQSLPNEQRMAQKHAAFMKADGEIRPILSDEQKKTLDQLEQQMHGK
jgi:periplasmic protein CpxP/Spy